MARVRIGELLMSRGACTREALSAAWEHQVIYGDRLGTNLLAIGAVDEATLAGALGVQHGVHAGHGEVLHPDPAAVALIPRDVCIKRRVLGHHVVDGVLYLLMRDPDNLRAIDEVRFVTHLRVQPVGVCEARLWKLLAAHCGDRPPMRPNPLDGLARPLTTTTTQAKSAASSFGDLVSEEDFQAMYARLAATPLSVDDLDQAPPAAAAPVLELPEWQAVQTRPMRLPVLAGQLEATSPLAPPMPSAPASPTAAPPPPPSLSPFDQAPAALAAPVASLAQVEEWQKSLEKTNPLRALPKSVALLDQLDEIELVEVADEPETLPPERALAFAEGGTNTSQVLAMPDMSPLSFDAAVQHLASVSDRDEIARIVLRAARARYARAALLIAYPHAFVGWQGTGEGFEDIANISIPQDAQSVFSLVATSRAHYLGPLQRFAAHGAWVKATGRRIPRSLVVMPILVRGRVASLLVADNGHDQHVTGDIGELLILAQHIAGSYEKLIRKG